MFLSGLHPVSPDVSILCNRGTLVKTDVSTGTSRRIKCTFYSGFFPFPLQMPLFCAGT